MYDSGVTSNLQARVSGGRLVLDEPIDLPDGTRVELRLVDDGDDLDDEERARLHRALARAASEQDEFDPAEVLSGLRSALPR